MRRPGRDRLEYFLYGTIMTSTAIALGLGIIFGFDEQGKRRTPVMDQPIDESWREAKMELTEFRWKQQNKTEKWAVQRGYQESYKKLLQTLGIQQEQPRQKGEEAPARTAPLRPPSYLESAEQASNDVTNNNKPRWWA